MIARNWRIWSSEGVPFAIASKNRALQEPGPSTDKLVNSFEDDSCAFCKTTVLENLEYQYLFVVDLQDEKETASAGLSVMISSRFLVSSVNREIPAVLI